MRGYDPKVQRPPRARSLSASSLDHLVHRQEQLRVAGSSLSALTVGIDDELDLAGSTKRAREAVAECRTCA